MAFHNNGKKYFHAVRCYKGEEHMIQTDGMWFGLDEKVCTKHRHLATVLRSNMTLHDAQEYDKYIKGHIVG